jgi:hypothetical protein
VAAGLLFVWLANVLPQFAALAAHDEVCQMACCKNFGKHSAKSCSGGVCHLRQKRADEIICGSKQLAERRIKQQARRGALAQVVDKIKNVPIFDETAPDKNQDDNLPFLLSDFAKQSCVATAAVGSANNAPAGKQNQRHNAAALVSFADKPRPPNVVDVCVFSPLAAKSLKNLSRRTPARAPPSLS